MDDARLPVDVERGASGGPAFKTTIITNPSGDEQRNQEWSKSRGEWNIGYGIRTRNLLEEVYAFFVARRGRARGFRFKDWIDFKAVAEPVGGSGAVRQLIKTYGDISPYVRNIVLPVEDTLLVYVDNMLVVSGYTLGANGVLTFSGDPGGNVKASFEYDVPARFDTDDLKVSINTFREGEITNINIVELRNAT